jgi:peptidyl-prolyl cis-trans isomerase C
VNQVKQRISRWGQNVPEAKLEEIKNEILENLISQELLYQKSQGKGIKVEKEAVAAQLTSLKQRFPDEAGFKKALGEMNLTEAAIKAKVERVIAIQKLVDVEIAQKVTISEKEKKAFYDAHPEFFREPEQIKASHILIKVNPSADESQRATAKGKIEKVQEKLKKGEDFAALAKEFSEGPSNVKGGDLGYFRRGQMVKPFEAAAFALKPNEVSDIVETQFGYHLIKLADKKPEKILGYEEVKEKLAQHLSQQKTQKEVELYIEKLKQSAKIEKFL